jgi:hypothetical protein
LLLRYLKNRIDMRALQGMHGKIAPDEHPSGKDTLSRRRHGYP